MNRKLKTTFWGRSVKRARLPRFVWRIVRPQKPTNNRSMCNIIKGHETRPGNFYRLSDVSRRLNWKCASFHDASRPIVRPTHLFNSSGRDSCSCRLLHEVDCTSVDIFFFILFRFPCSAQLYLCKVASTANPIANSRQIISQVIQT